MPRKQNLHIFRTTVEPTLCYSLDARTLTQKNLNPIDACYHNFIRRAVGIKAIYSSGVKHCLTLLVARQKDPLHHIVDFCHPLKDRIQVHGRIPVMQFLYWIETTSQGHPCSRKRKTHPKNALSCPLVAGRFSPRLKSFNACSAQPP